VAAGAAVAGAGRRLDHARTEYVDLVAARREAVFGFL